MNKPETQRRPDFRQLRAKAIPILVALLLGVSGHAFAGKGKSDAFFADAKARFDKADYTGAVIQAKNALREDRDLVSARTLLGRALQGAGDFAVAEVTLTDALAAGAPRSDIAVPLAQTLASQGKQKLLLASPDLNPADLPPKIRQPLLLIRASASVDLGDLSGALKTILEARAIDPAHPSSWLAEVTVRLRQSQIPEASGAVETAVALSPDSADAHYLRASILHVIGKIDEASSNYDKAIKIEPAHLGALIARAGLRVDQRKLAEASLDLAAIEKISPKHPVATYLRSLLAERENRPKEAQNALRELTDQLDRIPLDYIRFKPQILMLNGLAHFGLNEPEKAKQYFEIYLKTQGDAPIAKPLAQIYLRSQDFDRAIEVLETYLKARPADVQALALLGSALMGKGQYARATSLMERSIQARDNPALHTVLGLSLLGGGRTDQAIAELERALKSDPAQVSASTTLVTLYQRNGQFKKAVAVVEGLVKQHPGHPGYLNLLGMVKGNAGDLPGARQNFEAAAKSDARFLLPLLNLARLDIRAANLDAAENRLKQILAAEPKNTEALFEMASLENNRGRPAATREWLQKAVANAGPRETRSGLALVDLHLGQGNAKPALEAAKAMSAKATDELPVMLALARAHIAMRDLTSAKSTLLAATKAADYVPNLQVQVAALQMAADNPAGAEYSLGKALSNQPGYLPALALRSQLAVRQGDLDAATQRAKALLVKYPKNTAGHQVLGEVALARGETALAIESYRKMHALQPSTDTFVSLFRVLAAQKNTSPAIDLAKTWLKSHPKDVTAYNALGNLHARTGDFPAAKGAYEEALKSAPNHAETLNNLANVLLELKDANAVQIAERAVNNNELNGLITDTLGWALLSNGQKDRALPILRRAATLQANHPEIRYHLGVALAQSGKTAEARDELNAALKISQQFNGADKATALLQNLR